MTDPALLRVLASLAAVLLVMLAMAWLARRSGLIRQRGRLPIQIIDQQSLGSRTRIALVEVENTRLILGITPQQVTLLHSLPRPASGCTASSQTDPDEHANHDDWPDPDKRAASNVSTDSDKQAVKEGAAGSFRHMLRDKVLWLAPPVLLLTGLVTPDAVAQTALDLGTSTPGTDGSQTWSLSIQTLMLLTMLSFLPAILVCMTGFTRIIIVLGLLRNAMGTGASPPNSVLIGLALFLTLFTMSPVFDRIHETAWQPLGRGEIAFEEALQRGSEPLRQFMLAQTREADLGLFADIAAVPEFDSPEDVPLRILVPSFITSELKTAFQIGFTIFIPFLIIDLVVASVLMSLGMMMVPPVTISLPFKLMLFVLADGWHLLLGSLARSFHP